MTKTNIFCTSKKNKIISFIRSTFCSEVNTKELISNQLNGFATVKGTQRFIRSSDLSLYHQFKKSKLYINPIIHGPPINPTALEKKDIYDSIIKRSIIKNRCNATFVYNYKEGNEWYSNAISHILSENPTILREELVIFANAGVVMNSDTVEKRLERAKKLTNLNTIDVLIVELTINMIINEPVLISNILEKLESLCEKKQILSYGLQFDIPPFNCHNPPLFKKSDMMLFPTILEEKILTNFPHSEILINSISPSHAYPITHVGLPDDDIEYTGKEKDMDMYYDSYLTFIAMNPFKCYRGLGDENEQDDESELINDTYSYVLNNEIENMTQPTLDDKTKFNDETNQITLISNTNTKSIEESVSKQLNELCPELESTPLLQDKALRVLFSVRVDAVLVESELTLKLNKLQLTPKDLLTSNQTDDVFGLFKVPIK